MGLIDKETIRAEIEKLHAEAVVASFGNDTEWLRSRVATCVDILAILDTLPEQPVGEEYALQLGKFTHTLRVGSKADIDRLIRQEKQQPSDKNQDINP